MHKSTIAVLAFALAAGSAAAQDSAKPADAKPGDAKPAAAKPAAAKAGEAKPDLATMNLPENVKAAIRQAEDDAKAAKQKGALWTVAEDALKKAYESGIKGDAQGALKSAEQARAFIQLGMAQLSYPAVQGPSS